MFVRLPEYSTDLWPKIGNFEAPIWKPVSEMSDFGQRLVNSAQKKLDR